MLVHRPPVPAGPPPEKLIPVVETAVVVPHDGQLNIRVDGLVVPHREIRVAAEVSGRVTRKVQNCRPGRYVTQGEVLLEIDPRDYELEVERLTSQVAQARASLSELVIERANTDSLVQLAQEDMQLRQSEVRRLQQISQGAVSETELDRSKQAELAARNALQTLRNQQVLLDARRARLASTLDLAATDLKKAQLELSRARIAAPVDGVVVEDAVEQDSFVQRGSPLVTIEDTSAVEVRCDLKLEQVAWLWRQAIPVPDTSRDTYEVPATEVTIDYRLGTSTYVWKGALSRYEGSGLDDKTRTIPCRVLVRDPQQAARMNVSSAAESGQDSTGPARGALRPPALMRGMYVGVEIHLHPEAEIVRIPDSAVRPGKTVWVVRDGRLRVLRQVALVQRIDVAGDEPYWLVETQPGGLQKGELVVTTPLTFATDGLEVRQQPL